MAGRLPARRGPLEHLLQGQPHGALQRDREIQQDQGSGKHPGDDLASRRAQVTIEAVSVDAGHAKRDEHIRSAAFRDAAEYPAITFVSKKFLKGPSGKMILLGDLTLRGTTREITVKRNGFTPEVKDPGGMFRRGTSATAVIVRRDFGITWSKAMD